VLFVTTQDSSLIDMVLFVVVLVVVLVRRRRAARRRPGPIALTPKLPACAAALRHLWWVRHLGRSREAARCCSPSCCRGVPGPSQNFVFSKVAIYALIACR
jgi:hypothetical protein